MASKEIDYNKKIDEYNKEYSKLEQELDSVK
jgi:hypothetical protein